MPTKLASTTTIYTNATSRPTALSRALHTLFLVTAATALSAVPRTAIGQIFVTNGANNRGTIGEYTTAGATVNSSLVTGLNNATAVAVSGTDLFVANGSTGTIGEYTTSGAVVNASLVSGLGFPTGIAVSGGNLFVVDSYTGTMGEYTTSGATVNAQLVTGLNATAIAVSGTNLFCRGQRQDWRIHDLGGDSERLARHRLHRSGLYRGIWTEPICLGLRSRTPLLRKNWRIHNFGPQR